MEDLLSDNYLQADLRTLKYECVASVFFDFRKSLFLQGEPDADPD
jgi:hypothetical protein